MFFVKTENRLTDRQKLWSYRYIVDNNVLLFILQGRIFSYHRFDAFNERWADQTETISGIRNGFGDAVVGKSSHCGINIRLRISEKASFEIGYSNCELPRPTTDGRIGIYKQEPFAVWADADTLLMMWWFVVRAPDVVGGPLLKSRRLRT